MLDVTVPAHGLQMAVIWLSWSSSFAGGGVSGGRGWHWSSCRWSFAVPEGARFDRMDFANGSRMGDPWAAAIYAAATARGCQAW
jgi:hypothetical protein